MSPARVLVFGTYDSRAHPRIRVVIDGLRARGVEVEECNQPLGLETAGRVAMLERPWTAPALALRILRCWLRLWRSAAGGGGPADAVVVPYMGHFDVHLARWRFRRTPIVLDHLISASDTARDRGFAGPVLTFVLSALDRGALRAADLVLVDTAEHLDMVPPSLRAKCVVVPVGATDEWVRAGPEPFDGGRPLRVIFFGLFTPLQGAATIGRALGLLAGDTSVEATMVGRGQDLDEARRAAAANRQVTWTGMVAPEALPELVASHDVCLGIFGDTPKALRVVPNKAYQGIRAGCALVTADTAPQRRVLGGVAEFVAPADPAALADRLRALAADPARVASLRARSAAASDRFRPEAVAAPLAGVIAAWSAAGSVGER